MTKENDYSRDPINKNENMKKRKVFFHFLFLLFFLCLFVMIYDNIRFDCSHLNAKRHEKETQPRKRSKHGQQDRMKEIKTTNLHSFFSHFISYFRYFWYFMHIKQKSHNLRAGYQLLPSTNQANLPSNRPTDFKNTVFFCSFSTFIRWWG